MCCSHTWSAQKFPARLLWFGIEFNPNMPVLLYAMCQHTQTHSHGSYSITTGSSSGLPCFTLSVYTPLKDVGVSCQQCLDVVNTQLQVALRVWAGDGVLARLRRAAAAQEHRSQHTNQQLVMLSTESCCGGSHFCSTRQAGAPFKQRMTQHVQLLLLTWTLSCT